MQTMSAPVLLRTALSRVVRLARASDLGAVSRATERGTRLIDHAAEGEA